MKMSPWIFPFLYNQFFTKMLFLSPQLLIFCDAPFLDDNQPYVIIRSGRTAWSVGQLAYIALTSALYFMFLFFASIVMSIPHIEFSLEWGKVLSTLANTNAQSVMGIRAPVDSTIIYYFTPLQATWFTFLFSWCAATFLGLLIYSINSLTKTRSIGLFSAAFFIILDAALHGRQEGVWFSPVSWATIGYINASGFTKYPPVSYVYAGFALLIGVCIVLSLIANRRQEIKVMQPL